MELSWDDCPCGGTVGFSRDLYDKYSLAPTVKELCANAIAQIRSPVKVEVKPEPKVETGDNKSDCAPSVELEKTLTRGNANEVFPEPKVPFPRLSWLTVREQTLYMHWLKQTLFPGSLTDDDLSLLQKHVNNETAEFMKYLQDVAKICADDYNYMPHGAALYSEECLRASLEMVKNYPQVYLIHEMTSITGGKFNPGLSLNFEKQLLALGNVMMVELPKKLHQNVPLPEDYQPVSSVTLPVKKASLMHTDISNDPNAAKLYATYEPHVCVTRQAFLTLLNNPGPEYPEQWEIPVWVRMTTGEDPRKEVYIDSPLVKTEMTTREKSKLFHEESMKLALKRTEPKNVRELQLEKSAPDFMESQRSLLSFAQDCADFEVDLTDLETFGESATKSRKEPKPSESAVKPALPVVKSPSLERPPPRKRPKLEPDAECPSDLSSTGDSDEERLVIDAPSSPRRNSAVTDRPEPSSTSAGKELSPPSYSTRHPSSSLSSDGVPETPRSPSPEAGRRAQGSTTSPPGSEKAKRPGRRAAPRASQQCDQLGQILRMQNALLKPGPNLAQEPLSSPPRGAPQGSPAPPAQSHSQSLVKPCVSSYLEANQGPVQPASVCSASAATGPVNKQTTAECKRLLSEALLLSAEDESAYERPQEGNLLYCLYSLQNLLLMVRSTVPLALRRTYGTVSEIVPAHFLAKLEYQLSYGIECLTQSEVCQLWAERKLHPSTLSYVGHIDALTSKLVVMEELPYEKILNASCAFVPSKSLNILQHLLKKVAGLQEGRYLLAHKAGEPLVTIVKAVDGTKTTRATYDLHQAHSHLPQTPAQGPVPWVPVDPTHLLSFHVKHNRVPCTFPPRIAFQTNRPKAVGTRAAGVPAQPGTPHGSAKKKKWKKWKKRNKGKDKSSVAEN
ncbi:little elongation complex subunit 2 [Conger conger]|uniref:little elongation complex subunit 2 n=1 Tax=Conger conger TaxID=82655 RepID=UPI002A5A2636|nr:little elongation complex subunit 2 [Conger conger]